MSLGGIIIKMIVGRVGVRDEIYTSYNAPKKNLLFGGIFFSRMYREL
jgi:hypothetical protein